MGPPPRRTRRSPTRAPRPPPAPPPPRARPSPPSPRLPPQPRGRREDPLRPVFVAGPRPASMPATTHVRVRYKDTDTMSVVYYGNYLTYFEVGRVEYLRQAGLPMAQVNQRIHMPVVEALVRYFKPAHLA